MRKLAFALLLSNLLLSSCASDPETNAARKALSEANQDLAGTSRVCRDGPTGGPYSPPPLSEGEEALAEWDIAAADSIDSISPEQEWEIRAALGREMGLAPSQVNGWRDIYKARAQAARRKIAARKQPSPEEVAAYKVRVQKEACERLAAVRQRVADATSKLVPLEESERRSKLTWTTIIVVGASALLWKLNARVAADRRALASLKASHHQRALDFERDVIAIYRDRLTSKDWDEIVNAHANGDLARLKDLVAQARRRYSLPQADRG